MDADARSVVSSPSEADNFLLSLEEVLFEAGWNRSNGDVVAAHGAWNMQGPKGELPKDEERLQPSLTGDDAAQGFEAE